MWRQPKAEPLGMSHELFTDGAISRPLVPGTVARGHERQDAPFYTGIGADGKWLSTLPNGLADGGTEKLKALMLRGQDRFKAYCTPCHGQLGDGEGMVAHRGFSLKRPVGNFHTDRLRNMPAGHFYDVITNGYGAMYSYASRVEPQDRWAIVAYIRALQLRQNATVGDVDQAALARQQAAEAAAKSHAATGEGAHE
jgi:mono/diheme cytochrome c family protein